MKISKRWLNEWIDTGPDTAALVHSLNMAGLECNVRHQLETVPTGVVVGLVRALAAHPTAERLQVCQVDVGEQALRQIVCGASNVAVGMRVPAALPGATLPNNVVVKEVDLRGVHSAGMLCSAAELGLANRPEGLLEIDSDVLPGTLIESHLQLDDELLDLELTPNRCDCLSVMGLARELSALNGKPLRQPPVPQEEVVIAEAPSIAVSDEAACPHYTARVIVDLDTGARTPDWLRERLHKSGIRTIHPLVDVTNYVMLELGQPMHAFDMDRLCGNIQVRRARSGETMNLLNGHQINLHDRDLVVADDQGAIALAGIMGGAASAVGPGTHRVLLESAFFEPTCVAETGRRHNVQSDSRYRFERGVDPALQRRALERAAMLLREICSGRSGPVIEAGNAPEHGAQIRLRPKTVDRVLGIQLSHATMQDLLVRLGIALEVDAAESWLATAPTFRHDLQDEIDLVEEIARLYGYEGIPAHSNPITIGKPPVSETRRSLDAAKSILVSRGYFETITYSFVDSGLQIALSPETGNVFLDNPIAETMNVMRSTLWCGLLTTWQYNRQRQLNRARLFEAGRCFVRGDGDEIMEVMRFSGLLCGSAASEQWALETRPPDFYDLKIDVEAVIGPRTHCRFEPAVHPALHPGRSARILLDNGAECGWLGELHPRICQLLDFDRPPLLFELDWFSLEDLLLPTYRSFSEQPSVRRDLALVVHENISAQALTDAVREAGATNLRQILLFDVYQGPNLPEHHKSIALGLIFQSYSSTLTDKQVEMSVRQIVASVGSRLGAYLRGA